MAAPGNNSSSHKKGNVLVIGDIAKAFLDASSITKGLTSADGIFGVFSDALEAASHNNFSAIALVMSGLQTRLNSAIESLRDKSSARIVLLAQMYEEPIAIRLSGSAYKGRPLVDDYMICPVAADNFRDSCLGIGSVSNDLPAASFGLESRIRQLERLATEDDLTGLKNRRYIREFTRQIIDYAEKENGRVTLLLFDIDDFKKYNDLYGHTAGDEILVQAAHLMQRCCRAHDVVGRIGGDEFAVVFWDDPSILKAVIEQSKKNERRSVDSDHPHEAMLIAQRFISELEKTPAPVSGLMLRATRHGSSRGSETSPGEVGVLTISGGLASYPRDASNAQDLFEQADKALLEAKRSGKNRIYLVGKP